MHRGVWHQKGKLLKAYLNQRYLSNPTIAVVKFHSSLLLSWQPRNAEKLHYFPSNYLNAIWQVSHFIIPSAICAISLSGKKAFKAQTFKQLSPMGQKGKRQVERKHNLISEILTAHKKVDNFCHIHCVPLDFQLPEFYAMKKKEKTSIFRWSIFLKYFKWVRQKMKHKVKNIPEIRCD